MFTSVPLADSPHFDSEQTGGVKGWYAYSQIAIVKTTWLHKADDWDCCGCGGSACQVGALNAQAGCIQFQLHLGKAHEGKGAGFLYVHENLPSSALFTRASLRLAAIDASQVQPYWQNGQLAQVLVPQALVLLEDLSPSSYRISVYPYRSQYNPNFINTPLDPPFQQVTVEKYNQDTNRVRLSQTSPSSASPIDFTYSPQDQKWTMTAPGQSGQVSRQISEDPVVGTRTETFIQADQNQVPVQVTTEKYQRYDWGLELVQQIQGSGSSAQTNYWYYYDNLAVDGTNNYGRLKLHLDAQGHWERYSYDGLGRVIERVEQLGNSATNSTAAQNRGTTTTYSSSTPQISIVEKLQDRVIGKRYTIIGADFRREITGQTTQAAYNDPNNLCTTTVYLPDDSYPPKPLNITHPDGTMVFYSYTDNGDGTETVVESSEQPNGNQTALQNGTQTTTLKNALGQVLWRQVQAVVGGAPGTLLSQEVNTLDAFGRITKTVYLDGTEVSRGYSCCDVDWETDREKVTTYYQYDSLKRLWLTTRNGITTSNILDAANRVAGVVRFGTNNTAMVLEQTFYDTAGHRVWETNALGGLTYYTNFWDNGFWVQRTIQAYGTAQALTNDTRYYQDGAAESSWVNGVAKTRYAYGVAPAGVDGFGQTVTNAFTLEIKLTATGQTNEWLQTFTDLAGRTHKTVYADGAYAQSYYTNATGQLKRERGLDGVITLYQYNLKGEREYTVLDTNRNLTMDGTGADRITRHYSYVTNAHGYNVNRTETYVWGVTSDAPTLVGVSDTSTDGRHSWQTIRNNGQDVTTTTDIDYPLGGGRTVTVTRPDGTKTVTEYANGPLWRVTEKDTANNPLSQVLYGYDSHGRQNTATDARNGTNVYTYDNADRVIAITSPAPGTGSSAQTTQTFYDELGRTWKTQYPDGSSLTNLYYPTGELKLTFGSRAYPVGYTYDNQGRMLQMTNWTTFGANPRVTTWHYDAYRGFMTNKLDALNQGTYYEYNGAGKITKRLWARGNPQISTTYAYNDAGDLASVTYSDGTPTVTNGYDRRGRQVTATRNGITTTLNYNDANQLLSESYAGGALANLSVSNQYDGYLRRTQIDARSNGSVIGGTAATYGYHPQTGRLDTVSDGTYTAAYTYLANSPLINQITFKQGSTPKMTTTKQYDKLNRLMSISSVPSGTGGLPVSFAYQYNDANQRIRVSLADGSFWSYDYDKLGQVMTGKKFFADGAPVPGQQFEYAHDDIGNRSQTKTGGDQTGAGLRPAAYDVNNANQYTSRAVPGVVDILGLAVNSAAVTVNGALAPYRRGEYYWSPLTVGNGSGPVWQMVTNTAGSSTVTGGLLVPPATQTMLYDADGNLTNDLVWCYNWDGENRLTPMTNTSSLTATNRLRLTFEYDGQGRRIRKTVTRLDTSAVILDNLFLYDGWNLIAELNATNKNLIRSYLWGSDLSGSMQGAGGVGGLLKMANYTPSQTNYFVAHDGNGNVAGLIHAGYGTNIVSLEYGPFGEVIRATGPMAKANPFRWSTQYTDDETDLVCYLRRFYNPSTGRWLSRDPAGHWGGENPYLFVKNNAISFYDILGLWGSDVHKDRTTQWAGQLGIDSTQSQNIGAADDGVDTFYSTYNFDDWNWGWHFNRSRSGDSRLMHRDAEVQKAKAQCSKTTDNPYNAAAYLGGALHPLQDWVAHGDFNRKIEEPSLSGFHWWEKRYYWHNWDALYHTGGLYGPGDPDNAEMDANGPDGRAIIDTLKTGTLISNGDQAYWTDFHGGHQRINKTESLTKDLLRDFQSYIRANGKPCGECWKAFLGGN